MELQLPCCVLRSEERCEACSRVAMVIPHYLQAAERLVCWELTVYDCAAASFDDSVWVRACTCCTDCVHAPAHVDGTHNSTHDGPQPHMYTWPVQQKSEFLPFVRKGEEGEAVRRAEKGRKTPHPGWLMVSNPQCPEKLVLGWACRLHGNSSTNRNSYSEVSEGNFPHMCVFSTVGLWNTFLKLRFV